jgi:hypothetical protein
MTTVVGPNWISRTVNESGLSSTTPDIVQPDLTSTIGEAVEQSSSTYSNINIIHGCLSTINLPVVANPSCLQATWASTLVKRSSHTVPQTLLLQISTRPWVVVPPGVVVSPWSLMAPWVHVGPERKNSASIVPHKTIAPLIKFLILMWKCPGQSYIHRLFKAKSCTTLQCLAYVDARM